MRKPKIVIFSDGGMSTRTLINLFDAETYEKSIVTQTQFCPVTGNAEANASTCSRICCDMMIIVEEVTGLKSASLLSAQKKSGCGLSPCNKAIVSEMSADDAKRTFEDLGIRVFHAPLDFKDFESWVEKRRKSMDLSVPLAVKRNVPRRQCPLNTKIEYRVLNGGARGQASALNVSSCGICIRTERRLEPRQVVHLRSNRPDLVEDGEVRWIKRNKDGTHVVGLTFCIA